MVTLAELKKKASSAGGTHGERLGAAYTLKKGPSTKYTPAGLDTVPGPTPEQLTQNSASLRTHNTVQIHRPAPPPKRIGTGEGGSNSSSSTISSIEPPNVVRKQFGTTSNPPHTAPVRDRSDSNGSRSTPAPPYQYATNHDLPTTSRDRAQSNTSTSRVGGVKLFSQYNQDDKEEFFGMLDECFGSKMSSSDTTTPPRSTLIASPVNYAPSRSIPLSTSNISLPSYPPPQTHSSSALSLLHYILYSPYTTHWFTTPSASPPPLSTRKDIRSSSSWIQQGDLKSLTGVVLFGDASIIWYKLSWSISDEKNNKLGTGERIKKEGKYRPIPIAWEGEELYESSEMYGNLLVSFAENAVANRQPVARGECWDIASEGLNSIINSRKDLSSPFPSIGRTHGHLIYYGKASNERGKSVGSWKGGDTYVRPGDIVEWRTVTIREIGMQVGAYATLGDPEHTAIITSAGSPLCIPSPDIDYPIANLVSLTVVEQSQGVLPSEKTYDMAAMTAGEVWIYRPVSLIHYVGSEINPSWPPNCETWEVGQLE